MTMNALRFCAREHGGWAPEGAAYWETEPPKVLVAKIPYHTVKGTIGLGNLGLRDVVAWLAEDGLAMPNTPGKGAEVRITQARLDDAASLLRRNGYTVLEPGANPRG